MKPQLTSDILVAMIAFHGHLEGLPEVERKNLRLLNRLTILLLQHPKMGLATTHAA